MLGYDGLDRIHVGRLRVKWNVLVNFKRFKSAGSAFTKFVIAT